MALHKGEHLAPGRTSHLGPRGKAKASKTFHHLGPRRGKAKVGKVLGEFETGHLRSSSGAKVTKHKQAVAIALSEAGLARKKKR